MTVSFCGHRHCPDLPKLRARLSNCVEALIAEGHYDAGLTLRTYTHVTTRMQEGAATMGKLIGANV